MAKKKISPQDNASNMQNPNKGTKGVNPQYSQVHGNRSQQLQKAKKNKK